MMRSVPIEGECCKYLAAWQQNFATCVAA